VGIRISSTRSTLAEGERASMDAQRAVDEGADGAGRKERPRLNLRVLEV
jgi:hypothetical protein